MTFHELYDSEHPDTPLNSFMVVPCPHKYGYEEKSPEMCRKMIDCKACWEREAPEKPHSYAEVIAETILAFKNKHNDLVNHPAHYTSGRIECIDAIDAAISQYKDPSDAWLVGQVIKYLWRAPLKGAYRQDIQKAKFYLDRLAAKNSK
jgi:hypothetical protein